MPATDKHLSQQQLRVRGVRRQALADALVAARQAAGLTQTELAEAAGMSRSAVARLEAGTASIGSDRLWDLAVALKIRPSELFRIAEGDDAAAGTLDGA